MVQDRGRIEVIDDVTAAVLARMTPAQKWEMASRMVIEAREMLTTIVRSHHVTWSDSEIAAEVRRRMSHGAA